MTNKIEVRHMKRVNEKDFTDADAIKAIKSGINKTKERIANTKKEIASDLEMIKDKEEKMKTASDEKGKHGTPSPKAMYASNIKKIKERIAGYKEFIKDSEESIKKRLQQIKDIQSEVAKAHESLARSLRKVCEELGEDEPELEIEIESDEPMDVEIESDDMEDDGEWEEVDMSDDDDDDIDDIELGEEDEIDGDLEELETEGVPAEENPLLKKDEIELTEEELDAEIEKQQGELTEDEIEAEKLEPIDGEVDEAKSDFPKAKQIKALQSLRKKNRAKIKSANTYEINLTNLYQRARADKNRKRVLSLRKDIKKAEAGTSKLRQLQNRINTQLTKLEDERKKFNSDKRKAKKASAK